MNSDSDSNSSCSFSLGDRGVDITVGRNQGYGCTATGVSTIETMKYLMKYQELDDLSDHNRYRTSCVKCLRALSKARNIVPSSFSCRNVAKEGTNYICGGGFAVSIHSNIS